MKTVNVEGAVVPHTGALVAHDNSGPEWMGNEVFQLSGDVLRTVNRFLTAENKDGGLLTEERLLEKDDALYEPAPVSAPLWIASSAAGAIPLELQTYQYEDVASGSESGSDMVEIAGMQISENALFIGGGVLAVAGVAAAASGGGGSGGGNNNPDPDPVPATYDLTVSSPTAQEGDSGASSLVFNLSLDRAPEAGAETVVVSYQPQALGTATDGVDFSLAPGSVSFAPGQRTATVVVNILPDTLVEDDETVFVRFAGESLNSAVTQSGTILDDDEAPQVQTFDLTHTAPAELEGDSGNSELVINLTLSEAPAVGGGPVVVSYQTLATGSATPDVDFEAQSGTVTFAEGQTEASIAINVLGDTDIEPNETINVSLTGERLNEAVTATAVIVNDDSAAQTFSLTASVPTVVEGDSGSAVLTYTLTLSEAPNAASAPVDINYQTLASGSATPGQDFTAASGIVSFAAGQDTATLDIAVLGDPDVEADETVQVEFTGASLSAPVTATGVIVNDDVATVARTVDVTAGGSDDASLGDTTYDGDPAVDGTFSIANFSQGDVIDLDLVTVSPTIVNNNFSDGELNVQWAAGGVLQIITITGLAASVDQSVFDVDSFRAAFGDGAIV